MKRSAKALAAVVGLSTVLLTGTSTAPVAFGDDPNTKIKKAQDEIDQLTKDLEAADKKSKQTDKDVAAADADLKKADGVLQAAQKKQKTAKDTYDTASKDEGRIRASLAGTVKAKEKATRDVGSLARYSFESGGLGTLTFTIQMLTAKHDVTGAMALSDVMIGRQQGTVETLDKTKKQQESQVKTLAAKTREANLAKAQQDAAVIDADDAQTKATAAKKKLTDLQAQQKKDRAALEAKKKQAEQSLKDAQAEDDRLKQLTLTSPNLDPSSITVSHGNGFLTAPMPVSSIISPFGYRMHPVLHVWKLHAGDDFPFACGTPVYAAADGTVIETGYNDVSGNHVVISHGSVNGIQLATAYMHFEEAPMVSVGQKVKRGQQIGLAGMTGRVTGCHLHFEVHENGVPVNPVKWIS